MAKYYQRYKKRGVIKSTFEEVQSLKINNEFEPGGQIAEDTDEQNEQAFNTFELKENNENEVKRADALKEILESSRKDAIQKSEQSKVDAKPQVENHDTESNNSKKESMSRDEFQVTTAKNLGFKDMPSNLAQSLLAWTKSGRPVVNAKQWETRLSICRSCSFWSENKNTNVAKCMKCGCGSGKLLLTSSKCPLTPPKWDSL
jgi:rubrerythrin